MPERHAEERHALLLELLSRQQFASLDDMQRVTGASSPTVRRDLSLLERQGLLKRVRGGASPAAVSSTLDEAFDLRRRRNAREKGAIALAAADLVKSRSSILLNDGSTTLALAEELVSRAPSLWVATTGLNIGERLASVPSFEVIVIGGALRASSFGTSGPLATAAISQLSVDITFLSCDGADLDLGVRFNSLLDAEIAAAMAKQSQRVVVLADRSKIGQRAIAGSIGWTDVDMLITNEIDSNWRERLRREHLEVIEAQPSSTGNGSTA
ncbi:DeoR/GlpR family DNA-binding transcription regulator [Mycobacterium sp. NAZ190054]|uniref:DeoR/GlpR family DNA-binding transcription regulator n=1 Tax=Mycobacterium sp. NAZ190054 TaxID=1747766 RepID=UPI00079BB62D|nr:DeoR/GlpR family DNA-binding transcription regulator [Mycobacterium sp. NAZ190054]KWX66427.1 DeoR family transcriptional regulator [Mycobacterium sp. NAZ190054]